MSKSESELIERLWSGWNNGGQATNARYSDFYFEVVRQDLRTRHINAFEVLDLLTNLEQKQSA